MEIKILQLVEGAKQARGLTVIIDVFRAFSVACYLFNNGVKQVIPVGDIKVAYELKKDNPDFILIGERGGKIQPGFDYGNSPTLLVDVDFKNKTVVHTTSAGTQGIVNAKNAAEIITGSFVNAGAVVKYIQTRNPKQVSLVCMGDAGISPNDEDTLFAEYIKSRLENKRTDFLQIKDKIRKGSGRRFFNPANWSWSPKKDFDLCLDVDRFNFILKVEEFDFNKELLYLKKEEL